MSINAQYKRRVEIILWQHQWIANTCEGLFKGGDDVISEQIQLYIQKHWQILPTYRKCHIAKKILIEQLTENHEESFQLLGAHGMELELVNPSKLCPIMNTYKMYIVINKY